MWILILLICSPAGMLCAAKNIKGVVGRAITIDCHYEEKYHSHAKYWCRWWRVGCIPISGRVSITDNPAQGIFTVSMKDLKSGDTAWYGCGITELGTDLVFTVNLQVYDEPVSVPVLYLSPPNVSYVGGSVLVSCESLQGSLPIQYTWYEKIPSEDSKISNTSKLALDCQSFKHQHHQYYCTASNNHGAKSSEVINVGVFSRTGSCSYMVEINGTGRDYSCETTTAESVTTAGSTEIGINCSASLSYMVWKLGRWLLFALMVICAISIK